MNGMNHENIGHNGEESIIENHDKMKKYHWKLLELFSIECLMCNGYWVLCILLVISDNITLPNSLLGILMLPEEKGK